MSILISFIATNNDKKVTYNDTVSYGPTVSFVKNYNKNIGKIDKVFMLYNNLCGQKEVIQYLSNEINSLDSSIEFNSIDWGSGSSISPIDHNAIFKALAGDFSHKNPGILREIINKNIEEDPEYLIHISPGTPAMHSIWLLITRYIQLNWKFRIYQSYKDTLTTVDMDSAFYDQISTSNNSLSEIGFFPNNSKIYREISKTVDIYKNLNLPILIIGERGTGKTTLAKEIRDKRIIENEKEHWPVVVCGQFNDNTMRSELFGHIKGAFTGAVDLKKGLLEELDGDTLFLDEIGDLSKATQRLLIRALDEKEFIPLGASKPTKSSFRLIAATNKPISELREILDLDFFDRISSVIIEIPSIRNHRDDIEIIFDQVFQKVKNDYLSSPGVKTISNTGKGQMVSFLQDINKVSLEGNFRDIEFLINHYVAHLLYSKDESSSIEYAISKLSNRESMLSSKASKNSFSIKYSNNKISIDINTIENTINDSFKLDDYLKNIKTKVVNEVYNKNSNNKSRTAGLLGFKNHASITKYLY